MSEITAALPKPEINSFRRNLQRAHIDALIGLVLSQWQSRAVPGRMGRGPARLAVTVPADATALARRELARIADLAQKTKQGRVRLEPTTAAHLAEIGVRIDRALKAHIQVPAGPTPPPKD